MDKASVARRASGASAALRHNAKELVLFAKANVWSLADAVQHLRRLLDRFLRLLEQFLPWWMASSPARGR